MIIYTTEYQAELAARQYDEVVVRLRDGWTTMSPREYAIWTHQDRR